jgi:hypothetical protein
LLLERVTTIYAISFSSTQLTDAASLPRTATVVLSVLLDLVAPGRCWR